MSEIWIVWVWRDHVLDAETFETREEAMSWAYLTEAGGDGRVDAIEGAEGLIDQAELDEYEKRRDEEERRREAEIPKMTVAVEARSPEGEWARVESFESAATAKSALDGLIGVLGPDRVRTRAIR